MLLVSNYLFKDNIVFQQGSATVQTWISNRIHYGMCSLSDILSSKDVQGIGIL